MSHALLDVGGRVPRVRRRGLALMALGGGFVFLLRLLDPGLGGDAAKDQGDAAPLAGRQRLPEPQHAQQHGQHLAGDGDGDEQEAGEALERRVDEQLADGAARREPQHVARHRWVARQERQRRGQLVCFRRRQKRREQRRWDERRDDQVRRHQHRAEQVEDDHHLRAGGFSIPLRRAEDVVLHGVG